MNVGLSVNYIDINKLNIFSKKEQIDIAVQVQPLDGFLKKLSYSYSISCTLLVLITFYPLIFIELLKQCLDIGKYYCIEHLKKGTSRIYNGLL